MAAPYDSYDYPSYWQGREYENQADQVALKKLLKKIGKKQSLIDIGGGYGRLADTYAPFFKKCYLVDPSEKLLKIAKKQRGKQKKFVFKKAKIAKIPFPNRSFDAVLLIRVCHHLVSLEKGVKEAYRLLKPGGFLILEFANKIHLKSTLKALIGKRLGYLTSHLPFNLSPRKKMPFLNYHPTHVKSLLLINHFSIKKTLSVSNFRDPFFKKFVPLKILLSLEKITQPLAGAVSLGPSIFILAQKTPSS